MKDFSFIFLYGIIMGLVIEVTVLLFSMTGLKRTIARFQVISMLTGTGFTTDESSLIIDHPIRRRISAAVILFGYFSLAVIISAIAALLVNNLRFRLLTIVIAFLIAIIVTFRNRKVFNYFKRRFEHEMDEQFNLEDLPMKTALALEEQDTVEILHIAEESGYLGRKCNELILEEDDLNLLFIQRGDLILRKALQSETLQLGDKLMIFGNRKRIQEKFSEMVSEEGKF